MNTASSTADEAITSYEIAISVDGTTFTTGVAGNWPADAKMKTAYFPPTTVRYVRITAIAANAPTAAATDFAIIAAP